MAVMEAATAATNEQHQSREFTWTLTTKQIQGNLWIFWNTNAPFRAQQGQISVYNSRGFPANPQDDRRAWSWDDQNGGGSGWNSGLPYGSDWYCAWIAQRSPNGPYVYVDQLVTREG